ncbi:mechanosensitive ion channel [candidate division WOR-3 bacterium]|nr:mechanosensitive ion channel [candidate division WOR-3 bacterium]
MGLIYTLAGSLFVYSLIVLLTKKQREEVKSIAYYSALPLCLILFGLIFYKIGFLTEEYFKKVAFFSLYTFVFLFFLSLLMNFRRNKTNLKLITTLGIFVIAVAILHKSGYMNTVIFFLSTPRINIGDKKISLNGFIVALLIFYLSFRLSKGLERSAKSRLEKVPFLDITRTNTISMLVRYTIIIIGVFVAFAIVNIDFTSLKVLIGALGVGIGFGLREIVNNLISGFILLSDKTIVHNDLIEVNGLLGRVEEVGIRTTTIKTFNNVEVIVPNTNLVNNQLVNYTHSDPVIRLDIPIGVSYSSDPFKVKEALIENLSKLENILKKPEVIVYFTNFGESSLNFQVSVWTDNALKKIEIESEIRYAIWKTLKENNIEIPFPQLDVHVKEGEKKEVKKQTE